MKAGGHRALHRHVLEAVGVAPVNTGLRVLKDAKIFPAVRVALTSIDAYWIISKRTKCAPDTFQCVPFTTT